MVEQPQNLNKTTATVVLVIIVGVILAGGVYLLKSKDIKLKIINTSFSQPKVIFSTREVKSINEAGPEEYETNVFIINFDGTNQKNIYTTENEASVTLLSNSKILVVSPRFGKSSAKIIDQDGQEIDEIISLWGDNSLVASKDNKYYAYSNLEAKENFESSKINLILLNNLTNEKVEYNAKQFFENSDDNFSQVVPIAFSSDSERLYVNVWPSARGGDIVDPHGYYRLTLASGDIEEVAFSGSKELDYTLSEEYPAISWFNIYPESKKAIILIGNELPSDIYIIDLETKQKELLVDVSALDNEASLPMLKNSISPNEKYLILDRGVSIAGGIDTYNYGFHLLDLDSKELKRDFYIRGDFVGWIDNRHVSYKEYRNQTWDDQYYSLKVMDIETKEVSKVYTQTTDHIEGGGISGVGDIYYDFIGVLQ